MGRTTYRSKKTNILNNTFTGSTSLNYNRSYGDANLRLVLGENYTVKGNGFVNFDSPHGSGILLKAVKNSEVSNNKFKNVLFGELGVGFNFGSAAIFCRDRRGVYTEGCDINDSDYEDSGLPGWTPENHNGPGCVLLDVGTQGNYVEEEEFPEGAGDDDDALCYQINDLTMTPENPCGNNRIEDWCDECLDDDDDDDEQ